MLGACGLACSECPKYTSEKQSEEDCDGCSAEVPEDICPLPSCAEKRELAFVLNVRNFPACEITKKARLFPGF